MSMRTRQRRCAVFVAMLMVTSLSFAQAPTPVRPGDFKLRNIRQQLLMAPNYEAAGGAGVSGASLQKKWLRIETEFETAPDWSDDLTMKYYVLIGRGRDAKMFVGESTYVNVAKGRHFSAMFMHPNAVERFGQGKVEAVAVELRYQGRLMDAASDPASRERWWERFAPTPGYLLNPLQTPWSLTAHQRYEQIKPTQ
jgi:hypothetical protein